MRGLPRAASILVWITALAYVVVALTAWRDYAEYKDDLASWNPPEISAVDLGFFVLAVPAAVVFIVWLRRARAAADAITPWFPHRHGPGWVIGGWFFPVLFFWFPLHIVEDVITASTPQVPPGEPVRPAVDTSVVYIWWATWIGSNLVDSFPVGPDEDPTANDFLWGALASTASAVLTVVCAIYAVRMIRLITDLQSARPADVLAPGLPPYQH
jgi:uncharacterized protein DUF4328